MRVAFLLPAYNEGSVIADVIAALKKQTAKQKYSSQIVVIDDGSKDDTAEQAHKAGAHVITHILNYGSGGATATGLQYAKQNGFDIAVTLDADGQHKTEDVLKGVNLMAKNDYDLLVGSRLLNSEGMSKVKVFGNKGLSLVTNVLFGISVTDSQSGLRVYSRRAIENLRWKTTGYEFCSEMLWRAKQQDMKVEEYPIEAIYTEYSQAKGQKNWNGINIIKSLIQRRVMELFGE